MPFGQLQGSRPDQPNHARPTAPWSSGRSGRFHLYALLWWSLAFPALPLCLLACVNPFPAGDLVPRALAFALFTFKSSLSGANHWAHAPVHSRYRSAFPAADLSARIGALRFLVLVFPFIFLDISKLLMILPFFSCCICFP